MFSTGNRRYGSAPPSSARCSACCCCTPMSRSPPLGSIDELWGERAPATADKLVQGYVHALRKQLGDDVLGRGPRVRDPCRRRRARSPGVRAPDRRGSDDTARGPVELRAQALALWRGPPLDDVVLEGPERSTVARLTELRLATQIERIDAELALGRAAPLVGELESLAAAHPYQERLHAQLMLALYRSGRQADALDVYQAVRRALSDELGLQPGPELRALEAAILRQDDALTLAASERRRPRRLNVRQRLRPPRHVAAVGTPSCWPHRSAVLALVAVALLSPGGRRRRSPRRRTRSRSSMLAPTNLVDVVPVGVRPGTDHGRGRLRLGRQPRRTNPLQDRPDGTGQRRIRFTR